MQVHVLHVGVPVLCMVFAWWCCGMLAIEW